MVPPPYVAAFCILAFLAGVVFMAWFQVRDDIADEQLMSASRPTVRRHRGVRVVPKGVDPALVARQTGPARRPRPRSRSGSRCCRP